MSRTEEKKKSEEKLSIVQDLLNNGPRYNHEWVKKHPEHHLSMYAAIRLWNDFQVETSCEITAQMLQEKLKSDCLLSSTTEWIDVDKKDFDDKKSLVYQVVISSDAENQAVDHIFTVYNGLVLQSFFNQHIITCTPLSTEILALLERDKLYVCDYQIIDPQSNIVASSQDTCNLYISYQLLEKVESK
jgi:hypothetical protein